MNICKDIIESHIFKVKVWKSYNEYQIYVFLDKAFSSSLKSIFDKIENKDKIDKEEKQNLKKIFGKDYKTVLSIEHSPKYIYDTLYNDDNIDIIKKKIWINLFQDDNLKDIYFWVEKQVHSGQSIWKENFIKHILQGRSKVKSKYFQTSLKNYTGYEIDRSTLPETMNYQELLDIMNDYSIGYVNEILGMKLYHNARYSAYVPVNPFQNTQKTKLDILNFKHVFDNLSTLEQYQIKDQTIHCCLSKDVISFNPNIFDVYFPETKEHENKNEIEQILRICTDIQQEVDSKVANIPEKDFKIHCVLNLLHLRLNNLHLEQTIDLEYLFQELHISQDITLIKFKKHMNASYKINKHHLKNDIDLNGKQWTKWTELSKTDDEYLCIISKCLNMDDRYVEIRIQPNVQIDIRYRFTSQDNVEFEDLEENYSKINGILSSISTLSKNGVYIPHIENGFWLKTEDFSNVSIVNLSTTINITSPKAIQTSIEQMKQITEYLHPFVYPIRTIDNKTIDLSYRRINNFANKSEMMMFISQYTDTENIDMIELLKKTFSITDKEAEEAYEKYTLTIGQEKKNFYFYPNYSKNLTIHIKKSSLDYVVKLSKITDIKYHQRILKLLKFLIFYGSAKKLSEITFLKKTNHDIIKNGFENFYKEKDVSNDVVEIESDDFTGNDIEDDVELDPELMEGLEDFDETNKASTSENPVITSETDIGIDGSKFDVLKASLQKADYKLFGSSNYSRVCQSTQKRQPIAITSEIKTKIDDKYPGSYANYVSYGSTKNLMEQNMYICPYVWCPLSELSMSLEQFKDAGSNCPLNGEKPVIMTDNYWKKGDDYSTKYITFTKDCLPCCGKKPPKNNEIHHCVKQANEKFGISLSSHVVNNVNAKTKTKSTKKDIGEKYIMNETEIPLPKGRFGMLPKIISTILDNTACGEGGKNSGLITDKTFCFVRRGVAYNEGSSLFQCIEFLLDKTKSIGELIKENMSIPIYLSLNKGTLSSLFVDKTKNIYEPNEFINFKKWYLSNDDMIRNYIIDFHLYDFINYLKDINKYDPNHILSKIVLREYIIYNSFINFGNYVMDGKFQKTDDVFNDLFNRHIDWLNSEGKNIIILEWNNGGFIICNPNIVNNLRLSQPFCFIIKQKEFVYEPMVHVSMKQSAIHIQKEFNIKEFKKIDELIGFYKQNCSTATTKGKYLKSNAESIMSYLTSLKYRIRFQVLDYHMQLCGFLLNNGVYVPCPSENPILTKNAHFIFIDNLKHKLQDVLKKVKVVDKKHIFAVLKALYTITEDDMYLVEETTSSFVKTKTQHIIPIEISSLEQEAYLDQLGLFIGWEEKDKRKIYVEKERTRQIIFDILKTEILHIFQNNVEWTQELSYLSHIDNPLSFESKLHKLQKIIKSLIKNHISIIEEEPTEEFLAQKQKTTCMNLIKTECDDICKWNDISKQCTLKVYRKDYDNFIGRIADSLLKPTMIEKPSLLKKQLYLPNELNFDQKSLINGRFNKITDLIKNPFNFMEKHVEGYIQEILKDDIIVKKLIRLEDFISDEWKPLPIKLSSKMLPGVCGKKFKQQDEDTLDISGFCLNKRMIIDKEYFYKLFKFTNKTLNRKLSLTVKNVQNVVKNVLIKDYSKHLVEYSMSGPSTSSLPWFTTFKKMMKDKNLYLNNFKDLNSINELEEIMFEDANYWMSEYELQVFADLTRVNIIVFMRKTLRHPNGIICLRPFLSSKYYVLLYQEPIIVNNLHYDHYELIVKDKTKFLFIENDIPEVVQYMKDKCGTVSKLV